jgi:putative oxidoreductase
MKSGKDAVALIGRVALAAMFVISGFGKITGFADTSGFIASAGLPMAEVLTLAAIIVELGGGLAIVFGWMTRWAALALAVFLVVVTLIFHNYWTMPADRQLVDQIMFMKNLSLVGAMLLLCAFGPGRYSIDRQ